MRKVLLPLISTVLISIFLLTCNIGITFADDSVYSGSGYQVYPLQNTDVQLLAESIVITDDRAFGRTSRQNFNIDVDMTFKNEGAATSVQMGFPIFVREVEGEEEEIQTNFRTWVNGGEVQVTRRLGIANPQLKDTEFSKLVYTYTVSFNKGEMKKIRHTYEVGGSFDSMGGWELRYILRTGALWKGFIEDYVMIFKTKLNRINEIVGMLPRESSVESHDDEIYFQWNIRNYKPKSDFRLIGGSSRFPLMKRTISEDKKAIETYKNIMSSAEIRYAKNKVYATYGYPFKSLFVRAQFYYPGSPYKESASFRESAMTKDHLAYVEWLSKLEEEKLKSEK